MSASLTTTHTPESVAELAATVEAAARQGRVLTPWGAGTHVVWGATYRMLHQLLTHIDAVR